jgi:hypothetical protein
MVELLSIRRCKGTCKVEVESCLCNHKIDATTVILGDLEVQYLQHTSPSPHYTFTYQLINMALRQQNQPESGSRTLTQTATPARGAGEDTNNGEPSEPVGVLKLRGGPSRRQKVVWSEETVDNEGMGKKKSKSALNTTSCRSLS